MLVRLIKRLIAKGQTEGLAEKIDVFFAASRISEAEYTELMNMLNQQNA